MQSVQKILWPACVIALVTFMVYIPVLSAGFIWDDDSFLTDNPMIKASNGLYRFWCTAEAPDYFPLVSSMLWFEWRIWGMDATGYHVVNVLLHAISAILVWLVLKRLNIPGAWLAGLVFAVHPVNVESVAWITERKNTLPMVFYLVSILLYLKSEVESRRRWYVLSLAAFLFALLSKTSVVMLPIVLLGCAWWLRGRIVGKDMLRTLPFFGMAVVLGLVTVWFQYMRSIGPDIIRDDGFWSRLATAGCAVWFYLYKAILPYNLTFVYPPLPFRPGTIISFLPTLALLIGLVAFWRYRNSWGRPLLAGFGYYVVTLLPVLGFLNIYFMRYALVADHWQYTSIVGVIALAIGLAAHWISRQPSNLRTSGRIAAVVLVGLLSVLSWQQTHIYKNETTLWRDTLHKNPKSWLAHHETGKLLDQQNSLTAAVEHFREALQLRPVFAEALWSLGNVYVKQGRPDDAIPLYLRALEIRPDNAVVHNNLGGIYRQQGRATEALKHLTEAAQLDPSDVNARFNLGLLYSETGDHAKSVQYFREGLRIRPDPTACYLLSRSLAQLGKPTEAAETARQAWRMAREANNHELANQIQEEAFGSKPIP